ALFCSDFELSSEGLVLDSYTLIIRLRTWGARAPTETVRSAGSATPSDTSPGGPAHRPRRTPSPRTSHANAARLPSAGTATDARSGSGSGSTPGGTPTGTRLPPRVGHAPPTPSRARHGGTSHCRDR